MTNQLAIDIIEVVRDIVKMENVNNEYKHTLAVLKISEMLDAFVEQEIEEEISELKQGLMF